MRKITALAQKFGSIVVDNGIVLSSNNVQTFCDGHDKIASGSVGRFRDKKQAYIKELDNMLGTSSMFQPKGRGKGATMHVLCALGVLYFQIPFVRTHFLFFCGAFEKYLRELRRGPEFTAIADMVSKVCPPVCLLITLSYLPGFLLHRLVHLS